MNKSYYEEKSEIFKALSNPVRLQIIDILSEGEKCVCEITQIMKCEQPHISKSLAKLKAAGLITDRKDGLNVYYKLTIPCLSNFIKCLNNNK